jgi:DNA processing protein
MPGGAPELEPLLRLSLVRGVGPQRFATLVDRFGSAAAALGASTRELRQLPGIGAGLAREIAEIAGPTGSARLDRALRALDRTGAIAVSAADPVYPECFHHLADPPFLVFMAGDPTLPGRPGVAMVGTRAPTPYGRDVVADLGNGVAFAGYTVVSGMARGVDTLAHRAALGAGGRALGVLGHGIDLVYPPENRDLFAAVRDRGLLISEMPPGEKPLAGNFPRRNRLIAALSRAVLVVEMGLKSGAQHTVTYALELGREVMAVPGPITSAASAGTNQLIKDGARPVTCVDDVLEALGGVGYSRGGRRPPADSNGPGPPHTGDGAQTGLPLLSDQEARVLARLDSEPRHVDQVGGPGLDPGTLLGTLLELELKGVVEALPGKMYRRRRAGGNGM